MNENKDPFEKYDNLFEEQDKRYIKNQDKKSNIKKEEEQNKINTKKRNENNFSIFLIIFSIIVLIIVRNTFDKGFVGSVLTIVFIYNIAMIIKKSKKS